MAEPAPILTLLRANTPASASEPCERCRAGWGMLPGGDYCTCHYGQTLKAAKERQFAEEDANYRAWLVEHADIPPLFANARLDELGHGQAYAEGQTALAAGKGAFIWGSVGVGKSHLAAALLNSQLAAGRPCKWLCVPDWLASIRACFDSHESSEPLVQGPTECRLLCLDDIGVEKPTDWVREQLYRVINGRYLNRRPLIVTSNLSLAQLETRIGDRTCSRLVEMCAVLHLAGKDRRLGR